MNPLITAVKSGDISQVAQAFSVDQSTLNDKDPNDDTALIIAAAKNKFFIAALLIGLGAAIECENAIGYTALLAAVAGGDDYAAMVELLLDHGANINFQA